VQDGKWTWKGKVWAIHQGLAENFPCFVWSKGFNHFEAGRVGDIF
jgi:hypothetical protein